MKSTSSTINEIRIHS
jgi:polo-like kinase 4